MDQTPKKLGHLRIWVILTLDIFYKKFSDLANQSKVLPFLANFKLDLKKTLLFWSLKSLNNFQHIPKYLENTGEKSKQIAFDIWL